MPATRISLEEAYAKVNELKCIDFEQRLLDKIHNNDIDLWCGEYFKADLVEFCSAESLEKAVKCLPLSAALQREAYDAILESPGRVRYFWAEENYYLFMVSKTIEIYSDGKNRDRIAGDKINSSFMKVAWIDTKRWVILADEFANMRRREHYFVEILISDVNDLIDESTPRRPRGRRSVYRDAAVEMKAKQLIFSQPNISKSLFELRVRDWLGPDRQPGKTQFQELYGHLWTTHNEERRKSGN